MYSQSYLNGAAPGTAWSSNNTAVGNYSLYSNQPTSTANGINNTGVGYRAIYSNTTGVGNTALGYYSYWASSGLSNTMCLGYQAGGVTGNNSNYIEIGNSSNSWIGGQVTWSTFSDARIKDNVKENVPGLAFINLLHPVTYNLNIHRQNEIVARYSGKKDTIDWPEKYDIEKKRMTGFLAQDVAEAAQETNYDFSGVTIPENPDNLYSLSYSEFVVPLVKAVQELSNKNDEQQKTIELLLKRIEALENKSTVK